MLRNTALLIALAQSGNAIYQMTSSTDPATKVDWITPTSIKLKGMNQVVTLFPTDNGSGSSYPVQTLASAFSDPKYDFMKIRWQLENRSYFDFDEGETYMVLTHELVMPINMENEIEFILKFTTSESANTDNTDLEKDVMSCKVARDVSLSGTYWTTTVTDYNVRTSTQTSDASQDWTVPADDIDLNIHQCDTDPLNNDGTQSTTLPTSTESPYIANYDCLAVRCHAQRKATLTNADDFTFLAGTSTMTIAAGDAQLLVSLDPDSDGTTTSYQTIVNLHDVTMSIALGAMNSLAIGASSLALVATYLSF